MVPRCVTCNGKIIEENGRIGTDCFTAELFRFSAEVGFEPTTCRLPGEVTHPCASMILVTDRIFAYLYANEQGESITKPEILTKLFLIHVIFRLLIILGPYTSKLGLGLTDSTKKWNTCFITSVPLVIPLSCGENIAV